MNTLKNHLERQVKSEFIAIIQHMLHQEQDLQWLLATPMSTSSSQNEELFCQLCLHESGECLPISCDHPLNRFVDPLDLSEEACLKLLGITTCIDPSKGIMRSYLVI